KKIFEIFKYCSPIALSGLLGFFVDKIDMLILSGRLIPSEFAFYSMGCLAIPPLYVLEMSVNKVLIPKLSESFTKKENILSVHYFNKAISDIAFLIIPSSIGLYFFADAIIELL